MTWISEEPWTLVVALLAVALFFTAMTWFTQQGKHLVRAGIVAALAVLVLAVEQFWVTDRERVEEALFAIRDAAQRSDYPALESYLAPDFEAPGPMPTFISKAYIRGALERTQFEFIALSNVEISEPGQRTRQATADFTARASWKQTGSGGSPNFDATTPKGTRWSFGFRETEPGVWKVTRIDLVDTGVGNVSPEQALMYMR